VSEAAGELVRLTMVASEPEAEIVRGLLATEGIESMQRPTDFAAGALDGWAAGGAREILVREANLEAARELIARDERGLESLSDP
jgi:Putative prokaryotic signal transducing protein